MRDLYKCSSVSWSAPHDVWANTRSRLSAFMHLSFKSSHSSGSKLQYVLCAKSHLVNESVSARAKRRCTHQPECRPAVFVTPRSPLATVYSGDVTVHSDGPEWTVTSPEYTVANYQRSVKDMAGGHCGWYTDWRSIHRRKALHRQTTENIAIFALFNCANSQQILAKLTL